MSEVENPLLSVAQQFKDVSQRLELAQTQFSEARNAVMNAEIEVSSLTLQRDDLQAQLLAVAKQ
ncbi:hypothetical protein D3C76_27990 [compost metagenome]